MDKVIQAKIYRDITQSTIPEMINALYLMASATETLSQQSFQRIKSVFLRHGQKPTKEDLLSGINSYCQNVKLATTKFFSAVEPQIKRVTFDTVYDNDRHDETIGAAANAYDQFDADAQEIVRLVLLYIDRTFKNEDNYAKVFKTLRTMSSTGLFTDSDIARFKQK